MNPFQPKHGWFTRGKSNLPNVMNMNQGVGIQHSGWGEKTGQFDDRDRRPPWLSTVFTSVN